MLTNFSINNVSRPDQICSFAGIGDDVIEFHRVAVPVVLEAFVRGQWRVDALVPDARIQLWINP
jgi:hypothetical protein